MEAPEGSVLRRPGKWQYLPIKGMTISYDDATKEIMDTILYDVKKPDYLIYDPISHQRWGLRNGENGTHGEHRVGV